MEGFVKENSEEEKMEKQEEPMTEEVTEIEEAEADRKFKQANKKSKKVEKNLKEMEEPKKRRKWVIPVCIGIILIIVAFCSTIFALVNINNDKIISGVSISGIDVSGLTKEEATAKLSTICKEKIDKEIEVEYEDYETTLNPTLMEVNYDAEKAAEEAYLIGRGDNIFLNNYDILFTLIGKKNVSLNMTLNEEVAKQTISDIGVNLPGVIIESSHAIEDGELIITKGKAGVVIQVDELLNRVKAYLSDIVKSEEYIEIPVEQKEPEKIDIDKIHEEVYTEAKDAYYTKEPFTVYPEVEGVDFDVEAARALLQEDKEEYVIALKITKPKITINQIGSEAFPDQIKVFTTRYDESDVSRTTNLVLACQKINGKVVLPGETFSYNQALGPRTVANGYKNGKIYSNGQVIDGIGGGICQISSTLYNTVLLSNLEIVERRNHQFVTSYLPAGRDATVVYGMTDFKFKNTRKYPIRIVASAKNGIASVAIYGIKEENEYEFTFTPKVIASIPFTTKYEEDPTLPVGTEQVKQKGTNGSKVETYITKLLNGKVVSTTLLSRDTYDAMARIIVRGTKKTSTGSSANSSSNNNSSTATSNKPAESDNSKTEEKDSSKETVATPAPSDKQTDENANTNSQNTAVQKQ